MDKGKRPEAERSAQDAARLNAELDQLLMKVPAGGGKSRAADGTETGQDTRDSAALDGAPGKQNTAAAPQGSSPTESARVLSQRNTDEKAGKRRKQHRVLRFFAGVLCVLILIAGAAAGSVWYLREQGRKALLEQRPEETITAPEDAEISADGSYVTYHGKHYMRNENIVSILIMGVDRNIDGDEDTENLVAGEQGQADTILVAALDTQTGSLKVLNISRDSMVDVDTYNVDGEFAGVEEMQICLAYAYGDGAHESCLNTARSVSRLLYGIGMDAYASMEFPVVSVLNDAVGGVTVEVLEDLTAKDPALEKGARVTLNGDQARTYVRTRDHESLDANNARMARQRQYLTSFLQTVQNRARQNLSIVLSLYQAVQTYMCTSIDLSQTAYLASVALTRNITPDTILTLPGTVEEGEVYAEYRVDDEALYQIILDTFYEETDRSQIEIMTEGDQENANDPGHAGSQTEPADSGDQVDQNEAEGTSEQSGADGAQQETSEDDGRITVDPNILH